MTTQKSNLERFNAAAADGSDRCSSRLKSELSCCGGTEFGEGRETKKGDGFLSFLSSKRGKFPVFRHGSFFLIALKLIFWGTIYYLCPIFM